jgi:hypothetical protein
VLPLVVFLLEFVILLGPLYFAIFLDDNNRKAICRLYLNGGKKYLGTLDENKKETKIEIVTLDEIFNYSEILLKTTELYEK